MDAVTVLTICTVVFVLTFLVIAVFLVRALMQARRTARRAEEVFRRIEPLVAEGERTLREYRVLGSRLADSAERLDRLVVQVEDVGSRTMGVTRAVLTGVGGPVGRALALWSGVKTGISVFSRLSGRGRGKRAAAGES